MKELTIIGSGRVAQALAVAFHQSGYRIRGIISRNRKTAQALAVITGSEVLDSFVIPVSTDYVLLAVPDDAIAEVVSRLEAPPSVVVVHTSGSTGIDLFPSSILRHGVLYPLQTFTINRHVNIAEVPFFTEASDDNTHASVDEMVHALGARSHHLDSADRRILHLSAVFVCNFVNHMLYAGISTAERAGIDRSVFGPLVRETLQKALDMGPSAAQTGPAIRNDISTIEKHLGLLSFSDDLMNLYRIVSDSIIKQAAKTKE